MRKRTVAWFGSVTTAVAVLAVAGLALAQEPRQLTYGDLVRRLTDLERLAVLPEPGETCAQWSSYDRASRYDAATGTYVRWDANGDGHGIIRTEPAPPGFVPTASTQPAAAAPQVQVLAEMTGPGCIWRIWSATPKQGRVLIYLDGADKPAIDLPFTGYFDKKNAPFTRPTLVHTTPANGWNNYTPIPFQKSCKIVAEKTWGDYYHFTYSTFPLGTVVPTFKRELAEEDDKSLDEAEKVLANAGTSPWGGKFSGGTPARGWRGWRKVSPGGTVALIEDADPGAIWQLEFKVEDLPAAPDDRAVLRELVLKITWDGEAQPAVWCPLGDFFGMAPGLNKYRSLPMGVRDDGTMYSYWYMPYAKRAVVELTNEGSQPRTVSFECGKANLKRPIDRLMRFHAKWHRDAFQPPEPARAAIDWTMLKTQGTGRYVGVMLHVWNPKGGWWGEGDEKFFVDGEQFPSTIGTGSEDYFGYAWSSGRVFNHALHNQPNNERNSKGHLSVNRWHTADNVPFQKSFEAAIEKYYPNAKPTLYAAVAYWYLAPGGTDPYQPVALPDRTGYYTNEPVVAAVKGAIEGEALKILSTTGGKTQHQELSGYAGGQWSGDTHLWWTGAKPGDKLELAVPVAKAGAYKVELQLTRAKDYGIVQVHLDGKKVGDPIDLYNPDVAPLGPVSLGTHDLSAGEHKLMFEITGANDKAAKSYMVGLDYVKLTEAK